MNLNPYLTFDGTCEEAMRFYAELFGGEIVELQRFSDMPDTSWVPADRMDKVAHVKLRLGDRMLMASDSAGLKDFDGHHGFTLETEWPSVAEARAIFERLARDGRVEMEFQETFWAAGFGICRDRFGVPWMVNCDKE